MSSGEKNKLFQPMFTFPMVTIGILLVVFLIYYFPITARQEASLNSRAFHSLAAVSDSLQGRIGAYERVLDQAAKKEDATAFARYLTEQVPDLTAGKPDGSVKCVDGGSSVKPKLDKDGAYLLQFRCGSSFAEISFERILAPYLRGAPDQIFDEIVLADAQGVVLYQSLKTGSRISILPSPTAASNVPAASSDPKSPAPSAAGSTASAASGGFSSLWPISVAGAAYKLYAVPVTVKLATDSGSTTRLVLGGLLRESRFHAESMRIPGTALVSLILLFLTIAVATWPLLKFKYMRTTDRIPRRSAVYFFLSTLATIILICILGIHLRYLFDLRGVDSNLNNLAAAVERNFNGELRQSLRVLSSVGRSEKFASAFTRIKDSRNCNAPVTASEDKLVDSQTGILKWSSPQFGDYPYFDRIFWSNSSGNQKIKWEVASEPTPATPIRDRIYFQETLAGRLWRFSDLSAPNDRFRVDPVVSRNTGEYRAVISQQVTDNANCAGLNLAVVSMVTPLLSLIDPVMPSDYGIAVVDANGLVQFHSDSTKNGHENFLNELTDAASVRVALLARQGTNLSAQYEGGDYRLFIKPLLSIQDCPWSLIVFHNSTEDSQLNLERIELFAWLTLFYFALLVVLLMLLPHAGRPPTWVWPRVNKRGDYVVVTIGLFLIAPAFYFLIFQAGTPGAILLAGFLIPILSIGIGILKLKSKENIIKALALLILIVGLLHLYLTNQDPRPFISLLCILWIAIAIFLMSLPRLSRFINTFQKPSLENSFAALCALMLVLTGILPCVAFFKVAYDFHEELATRREQIQTIAALKVREDRVKARYAGLKLMPEADTSRTDVGKWLFIRRRLEDLTDRYDTEFLNLASGQIFTKANARNLRTDCEDTLPEKLVLLASIVPSSGGTLTRRLSEPITENSMWDWCREASNRLRLQQRSEIAASDRIAYSLPLTRALLKSVKDDSSFLYTDLVSELPILRPWNWLLAGLAFVIGFVVTTHWIKPTLSQMFLLKIRPRAALPEISLNELTAISGNMILLGFDDAFTADVLRRRPDVFVIDYDDISAGASVEYASIKEPVVAIQHFDHHFGDEEADRKKLHMLEKLATLNPHKYVLITTTIDPVYHFGAGPDLGNQESLESLGPGQRLSRWWRVLLAFKRMRLAGSQSCETIEQGRLLWSTCSTAERVALYQLAHDGWVNPRNKAALDQLQLRGLIRDIPFRFDDDGLRKFVSHAVSAQDRKAWERKDNASLWDGIRLMFVVVGIGILAAVLFFNQQSALGYILTGVGVLTPITKLLSEAQSFRALLGFKTDGAKS